MQPDELKRLKELIQGLPPKKRQKVLNLANLAPKVRNVEVKTKDKYGKIILPNRIVTRITCKHCGAINQHTYDPREVAIMVEPGDTKRSKSLFVYKSDISVVHEAETNFCFECKNYIGRLDRETLEEKYLELLKARDGKDKKGDKR